ncbi:MAG: exo-alpha-sialidase [Alphaproteobacteria bacterium]|nr:exo-alpha-sialidase [Alphaproteobacteria bacterium]
MPADPRFLPPMHVANCDHGIVYRNDREFCGWPFYCGLWKLPGGDVVAGFKKIPSTYGSGGEISHTKLTVGQGRLFLIRSRDDGASWDPASQQPVFDLADDPARILREGGESYAGEAPLDFHDPGVMVMAGALPALLKPNSRAWIRASADGGRSWRRPILLPLHGLANVTGHGPPTVRQDGMALLGLSTTSADGWTNRPLVYASPNGIDWNFLSFITPAVEGGSAVSDRAGPIIFGAIRHFYTRLLALRDGRILASLRFQRDATGIFWTDIFASEDGARTWSFLSRVNDWGAPGDIVEMHDGRIVCVYGYRLSPPGIRARVSGDGGRTWGRELILRDDGGSWDLGYPRVIEVAPGRLLSVYYMNRRDDPIQQNGGVRHIARTIFAID